MDVTFNHIRIEGQGQAARVVGIGTGQFKQAVSLAVIGLPMHRYVMNLRADT